MSKRHHLVPGHPAAIHDAPDVERLGSILSIWAHPDDETYLAGGVMATARDLGQRVVCVSVTAGEYGTSDPDSWPPDRLGRVRRYEAAAAMAVLGIGEHDIIGLPDGTLASDDEEGIAMVVQLIEDVRPDTILTFGPTGMTFHPDHLAVHHWVTSAWERRGGRGRLLYAISAVEHLRRFRKLFEDTGLYMAELRPVGASAHDLAIDVQLDGADLDRKLTALRAMASQTRDFMASLGPEAFAAVVARETFIDASRRPRRSVQRLERRRAAHSAPSP